MPPLVQSARSLPFPVEGLFSESPAARPPHTAPPGPGPRPSGCMSRLGPEHQHFSAEFFPAVHQTMRREDQAQAEITSLEDEIAQRLLERGALWLADGVRSSRRQVQPQG